MSGLLIFLGLLLVTGAALWWFGALRGATLQLVLAALLLGGAGYALQGRPSLPGAPKDPGQRRAPLPLTDVRHAMLGQFTRSERWLMMADSFASRGKTADAVGIIRAGLKGQPNDFALWLGLGNALVDHSGMPTPSAEFAYIKAQALAPKHPAPPFFRGLALARSGQREQALGLWKQALALTPTGTSYRPMIESGVAALSEEVAPNPNGTPPPRR